MFAPPRAAEKAQLVGSYWWVSVSEWKMSFVGSSRFETMLRTLEGSGLFPSSCKTTSIARIKRRDPSNILQCSLVYQNGKNAKKDPNSTSKFHDTQRLRLYDVVWEWTLAITVAYIQMYVDCPFETETILKRLCSEVNGFPNATTLRDGTRIDPTHLERISIVAKNMYLIDRVFHTVIKRKISSEQARRVMDELVEWGTVDTAKFMFEIYEYSLNSIISSTDVREHALDASSPSPEQAKRTSLYKLLGNFLRKGIEDYKRRDGGELHQVASSLRDCIDDVASNFNDKPSLAGRQRK